MKSFSWPLLLKEYHSKFQIITKDLSQVLGYFNNKNYSSATSRMVVFFISITPVQNCVLIFLYNVSKLEFFKCLFTCTVFSPQSSWLNLLIILNLIKYWIYDHKIFWWTIFLIITVSIKLSSVDFSICKI